MEELNKVKEDLASLDDVITQCLRSLLNVFYTRATTEESGEQPERDLGEIRIITDPLGGIGERIFHATNPEEPYAVCFVSIPDDESTYALEQLFVNLAISPRTLREILRMLEPDYEKQTYAGALEDALDMIIEVFFKATIIPRNSPIFNELQRNAARSC